MRRWLALQLKNRKLNSRRWGSMGSDSIDFFWGFVLIPLKSIEFDPIDRDGFTALRQVLSERSRTAQGPRAAARFIQVLSFKCIFQWRLVTSTVLILSLLSIWTMSKASM